eukprot:538451_1
MEYDFSNYHLSLWIDIIFIIIISSIHIVYSFKFTKFSLAYLNAKCEEKKSGRKWEASKLYLSALKSKSDRINPDLADNDYMVYTLWTQLSFVRNLIRVLLCLSCFVVLILWMVLQCNIVFEYVVSCFIYYESGSFLALIVFPALIFINVSIIRYIFYAIKILWSVNIDHIADSLAYEQQHNTAKQYAFQTAKWSQARSIQLPWSDDEKSNLLLDNDEDTDDHNDADNDLSELPPIAIANPEPLIKSKSLFQKYSNAMSHFTSPYWMAVHWRLLIIFSSIIATMIALSTISFQESDMDLEDFFGFQIFVRYLCLSCASWLFVYLVLSLSVGLYGRITSLAIY